MCDCQDDVNITSIPVGPTGPQGPQGPVGPSPVLGGTSLSNITVGTGSVGFVMQEPSLGFLPGQRVSAISADLTKTMSGIVTSYIDPDLVMTVDYTIGAGANADWTLVVTGEVGPTGATGAAGPAGAAGATGATGADAFTTIDTGSTPLGAGLYQVDLVDNSFAIVGMTLFVEDAGYYEVTITGGLPANNIVVLDLGYAGNSPADLIAGKAVTPAGIQGANGTNGTDGFNYETVDGNNIPAEATTSYQFLMRNADDTGYVFISLADLKVLLASIP